ncbi:hypothetical protein L6164_017115 [Bauhinia variegata]|uniref:Uncharacterized protein n=1 Tax=Bauhinia variegata TaxID=167791 RepID=A0ACB9N6V3_BAUVA|nr:hypothetical protein L6164_017115 [Bauhinia variegata]
MTIERLKQMPYAIGAHLNALLTKETKSKWREQTELGHFLWHTQVFSRYTPLYPRHMGCVSTKERVCQKKSIWSYSFAPQAPKDEGPIESAILDDEFSRIYGLVFLERREGKKEGSARPLVLTRANKNLQELRINLIPRKPFVRQFVKQAAGRKIERVTSVAPFGACFDATTIGKTIAGPAVPVIDLVLHKEGAKWRIYGANSMVDIGKNVVCLGFVDGGKIQELQEDNVLD